MILPSAKYAPYMFTHTYTHIGPKDNLNPHKTFLIYFHLIGLLIILGFEKIPKHLW